MSDTFGVDVSRYQSVAAIHGWDFVIVNVEDPTLGAKIEYARALNIPWGFYTWLYPGNGAGDMTRAVQAAARIGDPPLGYWLDYEQDGVSQRDIDSALAVARAHGVEARTGIYTYLYIVDSIDLRGRPLWLAYYPGNNDGSFPAWASGDARARGAVLWQYTSGANAPVGLDENVVIDAAWYQQFVGAPAPSPNHVSEDSMIYLNELGGCAHFQGNVKVRDFTGPGTAPFGVPADAVEYAGESIVIRGCTWGEWLTLIVASNVALGKNPDGSEKPQPGEPGGPANLVISGTFEGAAHGG